MGGKPENVCCGFAVGVSIMAPQLKLQKGLGMNIAIP